MMDVLMTWGLLPGGIGDDDHDDYDHDNGNHDQHDDEKVDNRMRVMIGAITKMLRLTALVGLVVMSSVMTLGLMGPLIAARC